MRQVTTAAIASPAATLDPEVVEFRSQFGETSPLDELVRTGAQRMLQTAIEAEVQEFVAVHGDRRDAGGNRLVVRNGYQPARELLTGAGRLEVRQPRVRDNSAQKEGRVRFSSSILPPYLRRSKAIDELIPWLYLKGISTGDFSEALQSLLGEGAPNLSPNVVVRLKEQWGKEYDQWSRRDLSEKQYVYVWADGIHVNVRLENEANQRQCLLVLMGATVAGQKELMAVVDGGTDAYVGRRERAELVRAPGGPQGSWTFSRAQAGRRRRGSDSGRAPQGIWRNPRTALLASQDRQRPQQHAQERAAPGQGRHP